MRKASKRRVTLLIDKIIVLKLSTLIDKIIASKLI